MGAFDLEISMDRALLQCQANRRRGVLARALAVLLDVDEPSHGELTAERLHPCGKFTSPLASSLSFIAQQYRLSKRPV